MLEIKVLCKRLFHFAEFFKDILIAVCLSFVHQEKSYTEVV